MHTFTTATARRIALLVLGLAIVLSGLGLGSSPASAAAPTMPRAIRAHGYAEYIRVYFSPPADLISSAKVTGYQLQRTAPNHPTKTWNLPDTAPFVDTTAVLNVHYTYKVRANSKDGWSPWSMNGGASRNVGYHETDPFPTTAAYVNAAYADFLGRPPTNAERNHAVQLIDSKAWTVGTFLNQLIANGTRTPRHQVIRLYQAYFGRNADHAGLVYWVDQITHHGKSINTVSSSFAASPEFKQKYGNLTNAQFVALVYQNVLKRTPSPVDAAYWQNELGTGKITRGRMMTLFSESAEYKALSRGLVLAADVYDAVTDTASTGLELDHWSSHIRDGGNAGDYAVLVYEYGH